jgi:putative ABC transport system permease protein
LATLESVQEHLLDSHARHSRQRRWRASLRLVLAWRNLAQDRVRLLAMLAGVSFSVILMTIQTGLLLGFAVTASSLIDRADAQLWVSGIGVRDVDQGEGALIPARTRFLALSTPGVASAEELVVQFLPWKRPDGGTETVIVVGIDLARAALRPWNLIGCSLDDLDRPDGIIVDRLYAEKLGVHAVGDRVEINGRRARVVGFTDGVRTFTQSPYIFTSLRNAKAFAGLSADQATYLLVRTAPAADPAGVRNALAARLKQQEVWTANDFSWETRWYWLFGTGAGIALVLAALLGLVVGTITVAQALYAATIERLSEFATLRAMGASRRYIYGIILRQALLAGTVGYAIGITCSLVIVSAARNSNVALLLPLNLALCVALLTVLMCSGAAVVAIRRAVTAEPAIVFK